jgi:hypothetical protein
MSPDQVIARAAPWIQHCFGVGTCWRREDVVGGDETLVRVVIEVADTLAGEAGLQCLDERWWLSVCGESGGNVVFDYEVRRGCQR